MCLSLYKYSNAMNQTSRPYDGTTPLQAPLASLYELSLKSQNTIAALIKQAREHLGIATNYDKLGRVKHVTNPQDRLAIYQYHVDRLRANELINNVELYSQAQIEPLTPPVTVETTPPPIEQLPIYSLTRVAFYTPWQGGKIRQVIALDGFYLNALMLATGIDKQGVPKWVQTAVDAHSEFDSTAPITKQVKFLIISELAKNLVR